MIGRPWLASHHPRGENETNMTILEGKGGTAHPTTTTIQAHDNHPWEKWRLQASLFNSDLISSHAQRQIHIIPKYY